MITIRRDFDFFLAKPTVIIGEEIYKVSMNSVVRTNLEPGNFLVSVKYANLSSKKAIEVKDGDSIVISQRLPFWFNLLILAVFLPLSALAFFEVIPLIVFSLFVFLCAFVFFLSQYIRPKSFFRICIETSC